MSSGPTESDRSGFLRTLLGWPARRLLDRRIAWIVSSFNYRQDRVESELRLVTEALGEELLDRRLARLAALDELALPLDTARFLNWAEGPEGPAARVGLWFNPPVPVRYKENAVDVLLVNERIVEQPYVFAALGSLPARARVLDVGGSESTIALSLASLGRRVHVVDPRGYPLEHPLLTQYPMVLDELPSNLRFDAAVAVSSIEHFGLGAYGQPHGDEPRPDLVALASIHDRLEPGGLFVLTVPCAEAPAEDEFQRVYGLDQLREMLTGWEILDFSVAWQQDGRTWICGSPDSQRDTGVALVTARKPG